MDPVELKIPITRSERIGIEPIFFLQSTEWEEFQKKLGRKTWRVDGKLLIKHNLPGGFNYLYCPRPQLVTGSQSRRRVGIPTSLFEELNEASGLPVISNNWLPITSWLAEVEKIARGEGSMFLKIDPGDAINTSEGTFFLRQAQDKLNSNNKHSKFKSLKFQDSTFKDLKFKVTTPLQPCATVFLDLTKTEEELLGAMHPKTRYNIRVAQRSGVEITREGSFEEFWSVLQETAEREQFSLHGREHYEALLSTASEDFSNELFFARAGSKTVAALLINFYRPGNTATYLHGASSRHSRGLMAPHLLHWHVIREAKKRGFFAYDFWGIDDNKWPGLTRFKKNFGGYTVAYPSSIDIVYRPFWYRMYHIRKTLLRIKK